MNARRLSELHRLASAFEPLTTAEKKLLHAAASGERQVCSQTEGEAEDTPELASAWSDDRAVRPELLHWLCTDTEARELVHSSGIWMEGAKFAGDLDLVGVEFCFRLALWRCAVAGDIKLADARLRSLNLGGTWCRRFVGNRLEAKGSLILSDGFCATAGAELAPATISATLDCSGGAFRSESGSALLADYLEATNVWLRNGFRSKGPVRLVGAAIVGDLDCASGEFLAGPKPALNLDGATIGGRLFLRDGFRAVGEVCLVNASIGRGIDCDGGRFSAGPENALCARNARIAGSVSCSRRASGATFSAEGLVVLSDASIDGSVVFEDATLAGAERTGRGGLDARRAKIGAGFTWRRLALRDAVELDLRQATVGQFVDDPNSWPAADHLHLTGLEYRFMEIPRDAQRLERWRKDRLDWLRRQPRDEFSPQPYEQLIKVLRDSGHEAEARSMAIARQDDLREYAGLGPFWRAWNRVLKVTIGHGYKPAWALGWGLLFLVAGIVIFSLAHRAGLLPASKKEHPGFSAFAYSLDTFLPIISFGQEGSWYPKASGWYGYGTLGYLWAHIAFGWVLTTLGVLGVTGLVRRE